MGKTYERVGSRVTARRWVGHSYTPDARGESEPEVLPYRPGGEAEHVCVDCSAPEWQHGWVLDTDNAPHRVHPGDFVVVDPDHARGVRVMRPTEFERTYREVGGGGR